MNTELLAKGNSKVSKNEFSSYYSIHFTRIFIGSLVSQIYLGYENSVLKGLIVQLIVPTINCAINCAINCSINCSINCN